MGGPEVDGGVARLPEPAPLLFGLDAVVDRVAHQVQERADHLLHDRGVHLDRLAADLERDSLTGRPRALAHLAREAREEAADGHQAGARDVAAQLAAEPLHAPRVVAHHAHEPVQLELDLGQVAGDLADPAGQ